MSSLQKRILNHLWHFSGFWRTPGVFIIRKKIRPQSLVVRKTPWFQSATPHKWPTLGTTHKRPTFKRFPFQYFRRFFKKVGRLWGFPKVDCLWSFLAGIKEFSTQLVTVAKIFFCGLWIPHWTLNFKIVFKICNSSLFKRGNWNYF